MIEPDAEIDAALNAALFDSMTRVTMPDADASKLDADEMSRATRLKLDRRIHNQRVALRDNWMIVERRAASRRWYEGWALRKLCELCDIAEIPKRDGITQFGIGWQVERLRERLMEMKS